MSDATVKQDRGRVKKEALLSLAALFSLVPVRQGWQGPKGAVYGRRQYRGKERYVAGYSHSRIGAHHFNGIVYDRILGYGETQEAAIAMMQNKLIRDAFRVAAGKRS